MCRHALILSCVASYLTIFSIANYLANCNTFYDFS
nr:MAG TPA: hypothetical protein [Caudoviricetes sp.]